MNNIYIRIIKSIVVGTLVAWTYLSVLSHIFNAGDVVGISSCIACISTMFYCTYTIVDEIRNNKK